RLVVVVLPCAQDHAGARRGERLLVERDGEDVLVLRDRPEARVAGHLVPGDRRLGTQAAEGGMRRALAGVVVLVDEVLAGQQHRPGCMQTNVCLSRKKRGRSGPSRLSHSPCSMKPGSWMPQHTRPPE